MITCIDFKSANFNKAINLSLATNNINISSPFENAKFPLVKLGDVLNSIGKGKRPASFENKNGEIPFYKSSFEIFKCDIADFDMEAIIIGDGGSANINYINGKFSSSDHTYIFTSKSDALSKFIFVLLHSNLEILEQGFKGIAIKNISKNYINNIKIPLPPLEVQQQIVAEYQNVEKQILNIQQQIQTQKTLINAVLANEQGEMKKLKEICSMKAGKFVPTNEIYETQNENMYPCFGGNGFRGYSKSFTHEGVYPIIGRQGALCGNVHLVKGKFHATEHAVVVTPNQNINVYWLKYKLELMNLNQYSTGVAQPGLSVNKIIEISCKVPPLEAQEKIVQAINNIEQNINNLQTNLENLKLQQNQILQKYLF